MRVNDKKITELDKMLKYIVWCR